MSAIVGLPPQPLHEQTKGRYIPSTSHLALIARSTILEHPLLRVAYLVYWLTSLSFVKVPYWFFRFLLPRFRAPGEHRGVFNLVFIKIIQQYLEGGVVARITPTIFHKPPRWFLSNSAFAKIPVLPDESVHLRAVLAHKAAHTLRCRYLKHSAATPNSHGVILPPSAGQPGDGKTIPAFWYAPRGKRLTALKKAQQHRPKIAAAKSGHESQPAVILYLHGGAYVGLTGYENDPATELIRSLCRTTQLDVLSVEYRLASIEAYPAQLQDAAAAWLHMVTPTDHGGLGIEPGRIIVLGDSAGGNLAIALTRWLDEMARAGDDALPGGKGRLGKPKGVMLLSPWVDVTSELAKSWPMPDIIPILYGDYGRSSLLRTHDPAMVYSPLISPMFDTPEELGDVFGQVRLYIACGGTECLRPEIEEFVTKVRAGKKGAAEELDSPADVAKTGVGASYLGPHPHGAAAEAAGVVFDVVEDMPHDFPTVPFHGRPSRLMFDRVGKWIREVVEKV